jgi:chromosome segregation protein
MLELYEAKISAGSPPEASEALLTNLQSVLFKGARAVTDRQRKRIYVNLDDERIATIVSARCRPECGWNSVWRVLR